MHFYIHPTNEKPEFMVGDDCFVLLPKDKHTGRAKVIEGPLFSDAHEHRVQNLMNNGSECCYEENNYQSSYTSCHQIDDLEHNNNSQRKSIKKRFKIQYYHCGSTYHANEHKLLRVYQYLPSIIITRKTTDYRRLARSQVTRSDHVADIGCSYGVCTNVLSEHAGKVLGLDNSEEVISEAQKSYPHIEFEVFNVLQHLDELKKKLKYFNKIFVDIGGNREVKALVRVLHFLFQELKPDLIVVKSETLFDRFFPHISKPTREERSFILNLDKVNDDEVDLLKMKHSFIQANNSSLPIEAIEIRTHCEGYIRDGHQIWIQLLQEYCCVAGISNKPEPWFLDAVKVGFKNKPLSYPWRETIHGVPICRLYNYSDCKNKTLCTFDHHHCHHCGVTGHIAKECQSIVK